MMDKYEQMSDFEINNAVAEMVYGKYNVQDDSIKKHDGVLCYDVDTEKYVDFAPCSDPADAWLVIFENNISILSPSNVTGEWFAGYGREQIEYEADFYPIEVWAENPLRAAMIVFLMMNGDNDVL
jgi:hypothetical protein